jgi:hypothetical protein
MQEGTSKAGYASKSSSFHVFPVKGSGSCMCQKEMSKRLVRCPCPDVKINVKIWLNPLHSLCPLHGDLERSKNNGCRSKVAGVGVLSSQYEKYFVRAYRNQHSNSPIPKKCTVSGHEDASLKIRRESAPTINLELLFKRPCNGISIHERATWHVSVTI